MAKGKKVSWKMLARKEISKQASVVVDQRLSRKLLRKRAKVMIKTIRQFKLSNKPVPSNVDELVAYKSRSKKEIAEDIAREEIVRKAAEKEKKREKKRKRDKKRRALQEKLEEQSRNERELKQINSEIRSLETKLKMNRRKGNKLPIAFANDGLDYILEACDMQDASIRGESHLLNALADSDEEVENTIENDISLDGNEDEEDKEQSRDTLKKRVRFNLSEDSPPVTSKRKNPESEPQKGNSCEGNSDLLQQDETDTVSTNTSVDSNEITQKTKHKTKSVNEDIYGRLYDGEGNVVNTKNTIYVPPSLRDTAVSLNQDEALKQTSRQLKGLLNRLSESNFHKIANEIENLYERHARNDMNELLVRLMFESVVHVAEQPKRMIQEHAVLVAMLHVNVGSEVGAYFLEHVAKKLDSLIKLGSNYGEGKKCNNLLLFLIHLYYFKVVHSSLIFDVWNVFLESFQEKDLELILIILSCVGFMLRKDDPLSLRETIYKSHQKAGKEINATDELGNQETYSGRVKFMMEILLAVRNNNTLRIPDYNMSYVEQLRKQLKTLVHKDKQFDPITVSYRDLLNADLKGRWWIVGSAWIDDESKKTKTRDSKKTATSFSAVSNDIQQAAEALQMTSFIKKPIFCMIMSATDYMDAFNNLMDLAVKNPQQRRMIVAILIECCLQEQTFNKFYAFLLEKFCQTDRIYLLALKYAAWDRFKELKSASNFQILNLAQLLAFLFMRKALPLSILKSINFAQMDKQLVRLLSKIMTKLLLMDSEKDCLALFTELIRNSNHRLLCQGLHLFLGVFMTKVSKKLSPDILTKLNSRKELVMELLTQCKE